MVVGALGLPGMCLRGMMVELSVVARKDHAVERMAVSWRALTFGLIIAAMSSVAIRRVAFRWMFIEDDGAWLPSSKKRKNTGSWKVENAEGLGA